jgi:hypothetical protein
MEGNDDITAHAEIHVDLAEVLRAHGDTSGAAEALGNAVAPHDEKGNAVAAEQCRRLLKDLTAGGPRRRDDAQVGSPSLPPRAQPEPRLRISRTEG